MDYLFSYGGHLHVHRLAGNPKVVRFLSHPSQVTYIEKYCNTPASRVEVCSVNQFPQLDLRDTQEKLDPESVLDCMGKIKAAPSAGGFRRLTEPEFTALSYASQGDGMQLAQAPESFLRLIDSHPLIKGGVGFAYNHAALPVALLNIMMIVYDIRRFNDPEHPGRYSRLKMFFRLGSPQALFKLHAKQSAGSELTETENRIQLVIQAWMGQEYAFMQPADLEKVPNAFLFRHMYAKKKKYMETGMDATKAQLMGCWRANLKFLSFIRALWLSKVEDTKFEPQKFFNREDEVESFLQYIKKVDMLLDNSPPLK